MIRWKDKVPEESIVVEFDFGADAVSVTAPTIDVFASDASLDPAPNTIKSGVPAITGAVVRQRLVAGVPDVEYFFRCKATNENSDALTIEASMRVVARPLVSNVQPRYLTRAQFERRFGETELSDLETEGNDYAEAENDAASLVDGFMAAKYSLPLITVPSIVTGWVGDIVRFKLWDERAPVEVKERYDKALHQLEQLAKGLIALPPDATGTPVTQPLAFDGFGADRVFTADTLDGF